MYDLFTVKEPVGGFGPVTTVLILLYAMSRGRGILASMRIWQVAGDPVKIITNM